MEWTPDGSIQEQSDGTKAGEIAYRTNYKQNLGLYAFTSQVTMLFASKNSFFGTKTMLMIVQPVR